jgi:hypothetical protein
METDDSVIEALQPQDDVAAMRAQLAAQQQAISDLRAEISLRAAVQQLPSIAAPQQSPRVSPGASPVGQNRSLGAQMPPAVVEGSAAANPLASPGWRGAAKAPQARLSDLSDYDGTSGSKLDDWLQDLRRVRRFFKMGEEEAVEFALVHFRGAADVWWGALSAEEQETASASVDSLATALRGRFQSITTARVAREQLHRLQQGSRSVDSYIAEFNQLHAKVADMSEADARAQFVRGLRREIADKLEDDDWETMQLGKVIAKAARIGNRASGAAASAGAAPKASVNQMGLDEDASMSSLTQQVTQAVLNALAAQQPSGSDTAGLGAKTQTVRGYASERGRGGVRGGRGGGRFGGPPRPINIPGVPAALVEQRRAAGLCFRCGGAHRVMECPNPISSQPLN